MVLCVFLMAGSHKQVLWFLSEKDRIFTTPDGTRDFGINVRYQCTGNAGMSQIRIPTATGCSNTVKMHGVWNS